MFLGAHNLPDASWVWAVPLLPAQPHPLCCDRQLPDGPPHVAQPSWQPQRQVISDCCLLLGLSRLLVLTGTCVCEHLHWHSLWGTLLWQRSQGTKQGESYLPAAAKSLMLAQVGK